MFVFIWFLFFLFRILFLEIYFVWSFFCCFLSSNLLEICSSPLFFYTRGTVLLYARRGAKKTALSLTLFVIIRVNDTNYTLLVINSIRVNDTNSINHNRVNEAKIILFVLNSIRVFDTNSTNYSLKSMT